MFPFRNNENFKLVHPHRNNSPVQYGFRHTRLCFVVMQIYGWQCHLIRFSISIAYCKLWLRLNLYGQVYELENILVKDYNFF